MAFTGTDDEFLRATPQAVEWLLNLDAELRNILHIMKRIKRIKPPL